MGIYSGFADIFFYTVPGLGMMHVYDRYMLIIVFLIPYSISIYLGSMSHIDSKFKLNIPIIFISILILTGVFYPKFLSSLNIIYTKYYIEILYSILILLAFNKYSNKSILMLILLFIGFESAQIFAPNINQWSFANTGNAYIDPTNNKNKMKQISNYFKANSNKKLIKYIDISDGIEKHGGLMQNFPWHINNYNDERRVSSYMGYDHGLSMQKEYSQKFVYNGVYDKKYLEETGVDFIVVDSKAEIKEANFLESLVDNSVKPFDIGNGYKLLKTKNNSMKKNIIYDNGLIAITGIDDSLKVNHFNTDWHKFIGINLKSEIPFSLTLQVFPSKYWSYYLNSNKITPILSDGVAKFDIQPGEHKFEVKYKFLPSIIFAYLFLSGLFAILAYGILIFFIKRRI